MQRRRPSRKYQLPYADRRLPVNNWAETEEEVLFENDSLEDEIGEGVFEEDIYPIHPRKKTKTQPEFSWLIYAAATGGTFFLLTAIVG